MKPNGTVGPAAPVLTSVTSFDERELMQKRLSINLMGDSYGWKVHL